MDFFERKKGQHKQGAYRLPLRTDSERPRLLYAMSSSLAVGYLQGQLQYFQNKGFDVAVLAPKTRKGEWEVPRPEGIPFIEVPIEQEIAPLRDLASLWHLWCLMRRLRPAVSNVGTPKAGLLGGLAALLNRVPRRIYTLHGLRFETTKGLKRRVLIYAERLACCFAHRVICVSQSVREKALACGLASPERIVVLGPGSCNGVDASRFAATPELMRRTAELRRQLGIPVEAPVVAFVGRLTRDKGIPELIEAFLRLGNQFPDLRLLLVGCFQNGDALPADTRRYVETHPRVIFAGAVQDTTAYYAIADVVVLPSHREGLPMVILEAHAAGKPVVGAAATGIVNIVLDGETGHLFPVGDVPALTDALAKLITDKALARKLGAAGQERVKREFQQERIWELLHREYLEHLQIKAAPAALIAYSHEGNSLVPRSNG